MAPRVEISPAVADDPVSVPRQVVARTLASVPRRRSVTLAIAAHSTQPGLAPCPWTLAGALQAMDELGLHVGGVVFLGDVAAAETCFERGARGHAAHALSLSATPGGPRQRLEIPESSRVAEVPMAWLGTNLVVLAPLTHRKRRRGWHGPCASAMDDLAALTGYDAPTDPTDRIGGRLVAEVFASSTTIVDAHWWAAADEEGQLCSEPATPLHVLTAAVGEPFGHAAVDAWLAGLLNLRARLQAHGGVAGRPAAAEGGAPAIISVGGRRRPWPAVKLEHTEALDGHRGGAVGLAGRAVKALWRVGGPVGGGAAGVGGLGPAGTRRRLAPPVTGPFAGLWREYRAVDLEDDASTAAQRTRTTG